MNIRKTSRPGEGCWGVGRLAALGLLWLPMLGTGCGMSQGRLLYMMGFGRRETVKAQFELTREPILILVDDIAGQVDWPPVIDYLEEGLGVELISARGANRIVPPKTLDNLRRDRVDYEKLSAREIGELCGAEQVLWIEVDQYFADPEFFEPNNSAWFSVSIKVINALEKERRIRVKLWPNAPRGHYVSVSMDGSAVARAKTKDAMARELADALVAEIVRVFTDYVPGDFED